MSNTAFNNGVFSAGTISGMHESMERLYQAAANLKGVTGQSAVAELLGESPQNLNNWESRGVSKGGAVKAQALIGCSPNWVLTGEGSMLIVAQSPAPYTVAAAGPTMQPILAWEHPDDLPPGEFVMIPRLDVSLSAGPGKDQVEIVFTDKQPQAFRADWIRTERLKPGKLACMIARGSSMEPSIWDGDSLVVDTAQREVVDGKVYALWYEGGERVKRLYLLPGGGLRIKSDNPEFGTIELAGGDSVRIIGRVVHRSGKGGL